MHIHTYNTRLYDMLGSIRHTWQTHKRTLTHTHTHIMLTPHLETMCRSEISLHGHGRERRRKRLKSEREKRERENAINNLTLIDKNGSLWQAKFGGRKEIWKHKSVVALLAHVQPYTNI